MPASSRALLVASLLTAGAAHAQIVVVRSAGERIEPIGLVPVNQRDAVRTLTSLGAIQVGYVFDFAALYTLDVWTSNGRYCLFMDRQYWVITKEQAALFLGVTDVDPPLAYRLPVGLVALVVIGLLAGILAARGKRIADCLEKTFPQDEPPA